MYYKAIKIGRENGAQIGRYLLDRGWSYECIISACIKSGEFNVSKPVKIVATVQNLYRRFNSRRAWNLSGSALKMYNVESRTDKCFGRPFCIEGVQCPSEQAGKFRAGCFMRQFCGRETLIKVANVAHCCQLIRTYFPIYGM